MKVGYLVHDLSDAAVRRRTAMMEVGGASVRVGGFQRGTIPETLGAAAPIDLGATSDARLVRRMLSVGRNLLDQGLAARVAAGADVLVARNLEMLAIAAAVRRPGQRLVYECLDLHRLLLSRAVAAHAVRRVEAALLARCDLVLTSSPAFVGHFRAQGFGGPIEVVENKLWGVDVPPPRARPPRRPPWRIAWFGMLRCRRSLLLLRDLANGAGGAVEVILAGRVAETAIPDLDTVLASCPHLHFRGAYTPAALPALYGEADFAWTIDWYEAGLNSRRLLPNRLYESLAFGVVPIAEAEVETGTWLAQYGLGWRLADPAAEVAARLASLTGKGYARLANAVAVLPRELVVAGPTDARALVAALAG